MLYKLVAMVGIKNEKLYLPQWMEFHIARGVQHFMIYDNGSTDGFEELLVPYLKQGYVTIFRVPQELYNQAPGQWMIQDAIDKCRAVTEWLFITSIDEYVFCPDHAPLPAFLDNYKDYAGVAVNWVPFNSGGETVYKPKPVIERFYHSYTDTNRHVKTFIQPYFIKSARDPHSFIPNCDRPVVMSDGSLCPTAFAPKLLTDKIRINHYHVMSKQEWDVKMAKGRSDIAGAEGRKRDGADEMWEAVHQESTVDMSLLPYVKELKNRLMDRYFDYPKLRYL
jgi:hypothetical protein